MQFLYIPLSPDCLMRAIYTSELFHAKPHGEWRAAYTCCSLVQSGVLLLLRKQTLGPSYNITLTRYIIYY